jgi:class 3 adenylate cyclase
MSPQLPSGTVTFLFTDIECSTQFWQNDPDRMKINMALHNEILRMAIGSNRGYVFKTMGDAFYAAFHTPGEALQAAVAAQSSLCAQAWGDTPIKVRMGIHTGNAEIQADGDYSGYASLSRVQRLMSAGHGGQTLLSQETRDLVRDELPQDVTLRDLGEHCLKDLIHLEHIYQVNLPNLPGDFPALNTLDT